MTELTKLQVNEIFTEGVKFADAIRELPLFMRLKDAKRHFQGLVKWDQICKYGRGNKLYVPVDKILQAQAEQHLAYVLGCKDEEEAKGLLSREYYVKTSDVLNKVTEVKLTIGPK